MTLSKAWAGALVSLLCFCSSSSAQVLPPGALPGVPLTDIRGTGTALTLSDDGVSGNIPLGFNFTLFGRQFNSAWVSNNGIVSFANGEISSYTSTPLRDLTNTYNYALFPYWTDLINQDGAGNPYYQLGPGTATFGWYESTEYWNGGRNSFEVQIWEQNSRFQFRYGGLNLNYLPFTVGYTGDIDRGEYTELMRHGGGAYVGGNFLFESNALAQCQVQPLYDSACPGYAEALQRQLLEQQCLASALSSPQCPNYASAFAAQCSANPLYSATCPGYSAAYLTQQCQINPLFSSTCPGYQTAYFNQQCSTNPLYDRTCAGYETAYLAQQCTANVLYSPNCPGYTDRVRDIVNTSGPADTAAGTGIQVSNTGEITDPARYDPWPTSEVSLVARRTYEQISVNRSRAPDTSLLLGRDAERSREPRPGFFPPDQTDDGRVAEIARVAGWEEYLRVQMLDGANYRAFEIYRGQRTVDNQRALRGLTGASERQHQDMVDQQYRR